ncbi:hypothetical protein [Roseivivax lentus]|nr:hypothetical protein [Roseivivax lentus]
MPVAVLIGERHIPLTQIRAGNITRDNDPDAPLEALVEAESTGPAGMGVHLPQSWDSARLGYRFEVLGPGMRYSVTDYDGRALDWFDFAPQEIDKQAFSKTPDTLFEAIPGTLGFPGAPEPRWWTIEDGTAYFDSAVDPEPNVLSMMLPEFFYSDIRNWFLVPAPMRAGHVRRMERVEVVDSFGVITELDPVPAEQTNLFTLGADAFGNDTMLIPNVAAQVVDCDALEEVTWSRDEAGNLVWAHERTVTDRISGQTYETGTETAPDTLSTNEAGDYYTLKNDLPRAYIPYVPRQTAKIPAVSGDIALRRGRTQADATGEAPQHRSEVVAESTWLHHETVPPDGVKTRRVHRFARGSDGRAHVWIGRDRNAALRPDRVGLRFDFIRKEEGTEDG